jgi:hypothetical protein
MYRSPELTRLGSIAEVTGTKGQNPDRDLIGYIFNIDAGWKPKPSS